MTVAYSVPSATATNGQTTLDFVVSRTGTSADLASPSSVKFETANNSAIAGTDYTATSGTLQFEAGVAQQTVSVEIDASAYDTATSRTFLFELTGYGTATGTIDPTAVTPGVQSYWYVPQSDENTQIPTTDKPGNNLKYQADYSQFSDPPTTSVEMPLAYIRMGQARADMNDYERVVVNNAAYVPEWYHDKDDPPTEIGTLSYMMLPRGVDRKGEDKSTAMEANAHLDGIFIYSDKNYTVSVKQHMNEVIKGDYVHYVEGKSNQLTMGRDTKWSYYGGQLRGAQGYDEMYGRVWEYDIGGTRILSISANKKVEYYLDASFAVFAGAKLEISSAFKAEISNSVGLEVTGLQAAVKCDIGGEFEIEAPFLGSISTKSSFNRSVSESITLSVDTGVSTAWTNAVRSVALASAAGAVAASSASWISEFSEDREFFHDVTGDGLAKDYGEMFSLDVPYMAAAVSSVTAAVTILAACAQKKAQLIPSAMPKIEMNAAEMTLSCGASSLTISNAGIIADAPLVALTAEGEMALEATGGLDLTAAEISAISEELEVTGNLAVLEGITVSADVIAGGSIFGTFVETA